MDEKNYRNIVEQMDVSMAFFRVELDDRRMMKGAVIDACNSKYLEVSEALGLQRDQILHHSYFDLNPDHDPRWDYYLYQAAVLRRHVHGGFRNREFRTWMEFTGGPAVEKNTCWMMFIDHTRFQDENERLLQERNIDRLTGVKNRNAYEEILEKYRQSDESAGVIMSDINSLKQINDSAGHQEGDRLIEQTADFLCRFSGTDLPYRIGGDEFVILLKGAGREETMKLLEQIRSFREVSLSSGAGWTEAASRIDEAVRQADADMYDEKKKYYRTHERRHV